MKICQLKIFSLILSQNLFQKFHLLSSDFFQNFLHDRKVTNSNDLLNLNTNSHPHPTLTQPSYRRRCSARLFYRNENIWDTDTQLIVNGFHLLSSLLLFKIHLKESKKPWETTEKVLAALFCADQMENKSDDLCRWAELYQ